MNKAFSDHFSSFTSRYAGFRPHYPEALFDYLATLVPRNSTVWDCAAGNGQASVDLARKFDRVIATDASREQIGSASPHPNIEYRQTRITEHRMRTRRFSRTDLKQLKQQLVAWRRGQSGRRRIPEEVCPTPPDTLRQPIFQASACLPKGHTLPILHWI